MEAENGVMQPQAKEGLEPSVEEARKDDPQGLWREHGPADILISCGLQNLDRINFYC